MELISQTCINVQQSILRHLHNNLHAVRNRQQHHFITSPQTQTVNTNDLINIQHNTALTMSTAEHTATQHWNVLPLSTYSAV